MVQGEDVENILSKHRRIKTCENLKKPDTKKELQSFYGMLTSLPGCRPSIPLNLPPSQGEFSLVECEAIALDRACVSCRHWIFNADKVSLVSDCSGILDMLDKPLNEVTNRRLQRIMERAGNYNIINQHIPGTKTKYMHTLSWLHV